MLVVDASVAVKWSLDERDSEAARLLATRDDLLAPDFLLVEVANVLWKAERQGRLSAQDAERALASLPLWFMGLVSVRQLIGRAATLARQLAHPVYDCLYLALAEREAAILVTADRRFAAVLAGTAWEDRVRLLDAVSDRS